jgi:hypothetical protein
MFEGEELQRGIFLFFEFAGKSALGKDDVKIGFDPGLFAFLMQGGELGFVRFGFGVFA